MKEVTIADEVFRDQPNMLGSVIVLQRMGVSLEKMEFLLELLFVCFQAMRESSLDWPLITMDEQDRQSARCVADNCLRLLGQLGLTGKISPLRHPAKRRRLKEALQEIMHRAAKYVEHARRLVRDFGRTAAMHARLFCALQTRLTRTST